MNSRERRAQAYRAKCAAENKFGRKVEAAMTGCSNRVLKAVSAPSVRSKPQPSADNLCLGDVALYAAGFRKPTESITAR